MRDIFLNILLLVSLIGCAAALHFFVKKASDVLEYSIEKEIRRNTIWSGGVVKHHDNIGYGKACEGEECIAGRTKAVGTGTPDREHSCTGLPFRITKQPEGYKKRSQIRAGKSHALQCSLHR